MNAKEALQLVTGHSLRIDELTHEELTAINDACISALRLLAAAEANGGERSQLIEELRTEADLCRNETADDVADLLDDAPSSLVAISAMANALKDERDAFKRHAEEVKRDLAASVFKSAGLEEENSKLRSALAIVHFKREPWQ